MKSVLISIKPKYCELIANGRKTIEVRKTRPKLDTPFKCYIYETLNKSKAYYIIFRESTVGQIIGEFVCDNIETICPENFIVREDAERSLSGSCLTISEAKDYAGWKGKPICECKDLYGWHISDLKIYDTPKELSEFVTKGECDCMDCAKCAWLDKGDSMAEIEDDCNLVYAMMSRGVELKPIFRPPQSWRYVEELK